MIYEEWINQTSYALGNIGITITANLVALAFVCLIGIIVLILSRGALLVSLVGFILPLFAFVILGWISYWVLIIIVLIVAGLYGRRISGIFGGEEG